MVFSHSCIKTYHCVSWSSSGKAIVSQNFALSNTTATSVARNTSLFLYSYGLSNDTSIKDNNFRGNRSIISSIVECVYHLNDGISCLQMQYFPVCGLDRELPAHQHASVDHWMTVSLKPRS